MFANSFSFFSATAGSGSPSSFSGHHSQLNQCPQTDAGIVIGANVTHAQIEKSALLQEHAACLVESCGVVGGPQVRNVAMIGGNVAHALPAADGTIGLLALDAEVEVCSLLVGGEVEQRWQPLLSIFAGPGRNTLGPYQLVGGFRLSPQTAGQASAFDRIMRSQGVALPILGLAAWLQLGQDGQRVAATRVTTQVIQPQYSSSLYLLDFGQRIQIM